MVLGVPIGGALLPRLSRLHAENNDDGLLVLYRKSTQMVGMIAIPAALVLAFFAQPVVLAWTGNLEIAHKAAPTLCLYALGNGFVSLGAFPYYLQFAKGDLKLHVIGNAMYFLVLIPVLVWAVMHFGATGAGWTWLTLNAVSFLFWVPIIHRRMATGLHAKWMVRDIAPIFFSTLVAASLAWRFITWPNGRLPFIISIGGLSMGLVLIAAAFSSWGRDMIRRQWLQCFPGKEVA